MTQGWLLNLVFCSGNSPEKFMVSVIISIGFREARETQVIASMLFYNQYPNELDVIFAYNFCFNMFGKTTFIKKTEFIFIMLNDKSILLLKFKSKLIFLLD